MENKTTPSRNMARWTKQDRKSLKVMTKEGKTINDIASALGRTPASVIYQRSQMGLVKPKKVKTPKVKTASGKDVKIPNATVEAPQVTTRDKAKEMTSAARQIARANGKRITMAMFFVEDL